MKKNKLKDAIDEYYFYRLKIVKAFRKINFRMFNFKKVEFLKDDYKYNKEKVYRALRKMDSLLGDMVGEVDNNVKKKV